MSTIKELHEQLLILLRDVLPVQLKKHPELRERIVTHVDLNADQTGWIITLDDGTKIYTDQP